MQKSGQMCVQSLENLQRVHIPTKRFYPFRRNYVNKMMNKDDFTMYRLLYYTYLYIMNGILDYWIWRLLTGVILYLVFNLPYFVMLYDILYCSEIWNILLKARVFYVF